MVLDHLSKYVDRFGFLTAFQKMFAQQAPIFQIRRHPRELAARLQGLFGLVASKVGVDEGAPAR